MNPNPDKRKNGSRAGRGPARPQVGLDDPAPTHSTPSRRKRALLVKSGAEQQFQVSAIRSRVIATFSQEQPHDPEKAG
jgi:hypothetical protein